MLKRKSMAEQIAIRKSNEIFVHQEMLLKNKIEQQKKKIKLKEKICKGCGIHFANLYNKRYRYCSKECQINNIADIADIDNKFWKNRIKKENNDTAKILNCDVQYLLDELGDIE